MSAFDGQADLLATLIASTAQFQTTTGTATVAAAKAKIGIPQSPDDTDGSEAEITYPRAIITDGGITERENVGIGTWRGSGSLFLAFEFEIDSATYTTIRAQRDRFLTLVSTIMRQAEVISDSRATPSGYSTSHLVLRRYKRTFGPDAIPQVDREQSGSTLSPLWVMEFEVEY